MSTQLAVAQDALPAALRHVIRDEIARLVTIRQPELHRIMHDAWRDMVADSGSELIECDVNALRAKWLGWLAINRTRVYRWRLGSGAVPAHGVDYAGGAVTGAGTVPKLEQRHCCVCGVRATCNVENPDRPLAIGQVPIVVRDARVLCWPCAVAEDEAGAGAGTL